MPVSAASLLDDADAYRQVLVAQHVHADIEGARRGIKKLLDTTSDDAPLASALRGTAAELDASEGGDARAEIAYATGRKSEFYCRARGLVLAEGHHEDGTASRLVLISGERRVAPDEYSRMTGDQWVYELTDGYRPPSRSQVWMTYGAAREFNIFEVRTRGDGAADRGSWSSRWSRPGDREHDFSVTGTALEPVRMYMAMHYHLWGSWDLGFDLRFEPGYHDTQFLWVSGNTLRRIYLRADRVVAEALPHLSVTDAAGAAHEYDDCWRVDLAIAQDPQGAEHNR
jgi:hypothetical protein